jgi:flagellar basal-body rod protein FlgC
MGIFAPFAISASALTAEKLRMDVIANNIANANTTRTQEGGPYQRMQVVFAPRVDASREFAPMLSTMTKEGIPLGVRVTNIQKDQSPARMVFDPTHPDANPEGYVAFPNVNVTNEMVDLISASRAYEANVTAMNASKAMLLKALEIGK